LQEQALDKLRKAGGEANGIRGVGRLLGVSKSTAHRLLHQLQDSGLIRLDAGPYGVHVALA
jgi:DNA-binding IclR family transcriptional regulator